MANRGTTPPPDILVTWPEPNYVNPDNQTAQLMAVEITLCSFTVVIMVLRLYSRGVLTKSIGSDDWLMAAALIFAIGLTVTNCLAPRWGWGVHLYDFKPEWIIPARKLAIATEFLFIPCVSLTKLSILVFYSRVFSSRAFRYLIYAGVAYLVLYSVSGTCVIFFQAIPLRAYWDKSISGKFIDGQAAFVAFGAFNCLSDLYVFLLPIREVWNIQLPKNQRISLILVFALGSVVCVAGIVRIYYLWIVFDPNNWDFTYQGGPLYIVTAIEGDLGILCASLPALKPLIHRYAPSLLGSAHTRTRPTGHNPSYPLSSYDADRRRDMKRGQTLGMSSYKMTSYVTGPTLSSESEENILPLQGSGGWGPPTSSRDDTSGVSGRAGIGKKVEIEVTVENVPSNSSDELEKPELARTLSRPLSPKRI